MQNTANKKVLLFWVSQGDTQKSINFLPRYTVSGGPLQAVIASSDGYNC